MDLKKTFMDASAPVPWILFILSFILIIAGLYGSGYTIQAWAAVVEVFILFVVSVILTILYRRNKDGQQEIS